DDLENAGDGAPVLLGAVHPHRRALAGSASCRQREREGRSRADPTLDREPAPVQLDELPCKREPDTGAFDLLRRTPHLPELLEHGLLIFGSDTDAGVDDGPLDQPVLPGGVDVASPSPGRALDGVGEQVQKYLFLLALIAPNHVDPVVDGVSDCDPTAA